MNSKSLFATFLFAALSIGAVSAQAADAKPASHLFGTHLDIKKVLSSTEDDIGTCGVVKSQLSYLDSKGQQQSFNYLKFSDQCTEEN